MNTLIILINNNNKLIKGKLDFVKIKIKKKRKHLSHNIPNQTVSQTIHMNLEINSMK